MQCSWHVSSPETSRISKIEDILPHLILFLVVPSHRIPSHRIPSRHPIPSHPIASHPILFRRVTSRPIPSHPLCRHRLSTAFRWPLRMQGPRRLRRSRRRRSPWKSEMKRSPSMSSGEMSCPITSYHIIALSCHVVSYRIMSHRTFSIMFFLRSRLPCTSLLLLVRA